MMTPLIYYIVRKLLNNEFLNFLTIFAIEVENINALSHIVHRDVEALFATIVIELVGINDLTSDIHDLNVNYLSFIDSDFNSNIC